MSGGGPPHRKASKMTGEQATTAVTTPDAEPIAVQASKWRIKMERAAWSALDAKGRTCVRHWYRIFRRGGQDRTTARDMCWALCHGADMGSYWTGRS